MTEDLHIEVIAKDRYYDHLCIDGLSVEEMNYILDGNGDGKEDRRDRLVAVMNKRTNSTMYDAWKWGYGIYSIRHVGGHLFVEIGNNCD